MNYIEYINLFWHLNREHTFTSVEVHLYFKLLDTSNKLGWKNPFTQSNRMLYTEMMITDKTLQSAMKRLVNSGLLDYKSGRGRRKYSEYFLKSSDKTRNISLSSCENIPNIYKHKPNQTKQSVFTPPTVEELERFYQKKHALTAEQAVYLANRFVNYYESVGWQVGRYPMKKWEGGATRSLEWLSEKENVRDVRSGGYVHAQKTKKSHEHTASGHDNNRSYETF